MTEEDAAIQESATYRLMHPTARAMLIVGVPVLAIGQLAGVFQWEAIGITPRRSGEVLYLTIPSIAVWALIAVASLLLVADSVTRYLHREADGNE